MSRLFCEVTLYFRNLSIMYLVVSIAKR